jgi:ABC-type nitrate/sulfonate/bicarbonate transport system substrate-binding protein
MSKFLRASVFTAFVLVVVATIFFVWRSQNNDETPSDTTVRVGYLNITASLPLFVAEANGYFTEEGVSIETFPIQTSNQLVDGVLAGQLDGVIEASAAPVLSAEARAPGRIKIFSVSAITTEAPFDALLVREGGPSSLNGLEGRRIGVFPGTTATSLLRAFLEDEGVEVSNVTFAPIPPEAQLAALESGSIDALHAYEPVTTIAVQRGGVQRLHGSVYADMLSPNPQGVAFVATDFARLHPAEAAAFVRAVERALEFMRSNPAESRRILAERLNLDPRVARDTVLLYMTPHAEIPVDTLQSYADLLLRIGELSDPVRTSSMLYAD